MWLRLAVKTTPHITDGCTRIRANGYLAHLRMSSTTEKILVWITMFTNTVQVNVRWFLVDINGVHDQSSSRATK